MLNSVISSGSKVDRFAGKKVMKLSAQNTMKLNRAALEHIGGKLGMFAFVADGTEENEYYVAVGTEAEAGGQKGSKLSIVGNKNEYNEKTFTQLSFTSAELGNTLYNAAYVVEIEEEGQLEAKTGLTFYGMKILETREEYRARIAKNKKEGKKEDDDDDDDKGAEGDVPSSPASEASAEGVVDEGSSRRSRRERTE